MPGETSLWRLLENACPVLGPESYVFITTQATALFDHPAIVGMFREEEGVTLIAERQWAESEGFDFIYPCRRITLTIHSSLAAVGFMAAVSSALAAEGISCNPVSAVYHDHLFVPESDAVRALSVLQKLVASGSSANSEAGNQPAGRHTP